MSCHLTPHLSSCSHDYSLLIVPKPGSSSFSQVYEACSPDDEAALKAFINRYIFEFMKPYIEQMILPGNETLEHTILINRLFISVHRKKLKANADIIKTLALEAFFYEAARGLFCRPDRLIGHPLGKTIDSLKLMAKNSLIFRKAIKPLEEEIKKLKKRIQQLEELQNFQHAEKNNIDKQILEAPYDDELASREEELSSISMHLLREICDTSDKIETFKSSLRMHQFDANDAVEQSLSAKKVIKAELEELAKNEAFVKHLNDLKNAVKVEFAMVDIDHETFTKMALKAIGTFITQRAKGCFFERKL